MPSKPDELQGQPNAHNAIQKNDSMDTIQKGTKNHCPSCGSAVAVTLMNIDLRSYFAGQVIVAISLHDAKAGKLIPIDMAKGAYEVADAMLTEREK